MLNTQNYKATWIQTVIFLTASALGLASMAFAQPEWEEPRKSKQEINATNSSKTDAQSSLFEEISKASKRVDEFIELDKVVSERTAQYQEKCLDQQKEGESSSLFTPLMSDSAAYQCDQKDHESKEPSSPTCAGEACNPEVGKCKTYTIRCRESLSSSGDDGVRGRCDMNTCEVFLLSSICELMGWNDGDRFCHNCFWRGIREQRPTNVGDIINVCLVAHEGQHGIDGPKVRNCATEENAFDRQVRCMRAYYDSLCKAEPPGMTKNECGALQAYTCAFEGAKALQTCRCERGSPRQGRPCPACEQRCNETAASCEVGSVVPRDELPEFYKGQCEHFEHGYCRKKH